MLLVRYIYTLQLVGRVCEQHIEYNKSTSVYLQPLDEVNASSQGQHFLLAVSAPAVHIQTSVALATSTAYQVKE